MKIFSVDVGIKNLGLCILDSNGSILDWQVVSISNSEKKSKAVVDIADNLIEVLDDVFISLTEENTDDASPPQPITVLIENQPAFKTPTMKSIQMIIYSYFCIMRKHHNMSMEILNISATRKLKYLEKYYEDMDRSAKSYKKNKQNAIDYVKKLLVAKFPERLEWFLTHKKNDDLADDLLQGLSFLDK